MTVSVIQISIYYYMLVILDFNNTKNINLIFNVLNNKNK